MNKAQIIQAIGNAFKSGCNSILITGSWGVGKSTAIQEYLRIACESHVRISALGIESGEKFIERIGLEQIVSKAPIPSSSTTIEKWIRAISAIPIVNKFTGSSNNSIGLLGYAFVRGKTIWVDDIERLDPTAIKQILGEIQNLIESKQCKAIIAANESFLDSDQLWHPLIEKCISVHISFDRDIEEICEVAYGGRLDLMYLQKATRSLGVNNIRAIKRIISYYDMMRTSVPGLLEETDKQIALTLSMGVVAKFGLDPRLPTLDQLLTWQTKYFPRESKNEPMQVQNQFLLDLGYFETDQLDVEIFKFIINGTLDQDEFIEKATETNSKFRKNEARDRYQDVWTLVHASFDSNIDDIALAFQSVFYLYPDIFHPRQYNEVLCLYKAAQRQDLIDSLLRNIPDAFPISESEADASRFAFDSYSYEKEIEDRIKKIKMPADGNSLERIIKRIAGQNAWNSADEVVLANLPVEDYISFFQTCRDGHLNSYIDRLFEFGGLSNSSETQKRIASKTSDALKEVAKSDPLNLFRIIKWNSRIRIFETASTQE